MSLKAVVGQNIINDVFKQKKGEKIQWRVLVVDHQALKIVSACCKMQEISAEGITIVEDITLSREPLRNMEAVYLVTPSEKSVNALMKDFSSPHLTMYRCAHVHFTEACPDWLFEKLSKAYVAKHIQTLKEINVAFIPYESQVFSLDSPETFQCVYNPLFAGNRVANLERVAEQIATLCATLGEYPSVRFRSEFEMNAQLARLVQQKLDAHKADEPTMGKGPEKARSQLIILDRGFDCVSPLLHELTLQAMAYDLLPIRNDIFKYKVSSKGPEQEVVLDDNDRMWAELRHKHIFVVSKIVPEYLKKFKESKRMDSSDTQKVGDLSHLIKKMPQYQEELRKYSTYLNMAEDCLKAYQDELCKVEQDLAMGTDAEGEPIKDRMHNINKILLSETINNKDKMRVILLYIQSRNGISEENLNKFVHHTQILPQEKQAIVNMANLGVNVVVEGKEKKTYQFPRKNRPTEYTTSRWTPVVKDLMEDAIDDKLDSKYFPYLSGRAVPSNYQATISARYGNWHKNQSEQRVKNVPRLIIFFVGGVSFSEIRCAYEVTAANKKWEVIIGASHIMTPEDFLSNSANLST